MVARNMGEGNRNYMYAASEVPSRGQIFKRCLPLDEVTCDIT
jgi:hypothetical protein